MNIYVISNDNDNRRLIKVGETNDEWEKRERAYKTSGYVPHLWHFEYDVDFKDDDIKKILVNDLDYTVCKDHGDEWYELKDAETENDFTKKVKAIIVALKHKQPIDLKRIEDFPPRDEQKECIKKTIEAFQKGANKFLWNCKMRFGKTFTTYQLMKQASYQNILVLTWKIAVEKSWKEDLLSHVDFKGINFLGRDDLNKFDENKKNVVFLSIPLLLANSEREAVKNAQENDEGSDREITEEKIKGLGKKFPKIKWDLLVIDEAHYGIRAKNTANILKLLKYERKLELSGTPFKILDDAEYKTEEIYNWTYQQEQAAKKAHEKDGERNPYKDLPNMHIYTYDGAQDLPDENKFSDDDFTINKLFKVQNTKKGYEFVNITSVKRMIDFMCGDQFDLAEDKDIKDADVLLPYFNGMVEKNKKSLWFLPSVASVCAMETLLKNHRFFKGYCIINASGEGVGSSQNALDVFLEQEKKTDKIICLSCGMLNTGVTIKSLNSVVMLQDKHSAQDFFQSIFRCQSPCKGKSDCYVFDFNPKRYFENLLSAIRLADSRDKKKKLEENLIETHLYIDGIMKDTNYDEIMHYVTLDFNSPDKVKKAFLKSNNIQIEKLERADKRILSIIDSIPLYKNEVKNTDEKKKGKGSGKKTQTAPADPNREKRKKESLYDIRKAKLDILIASLTIFIYITNAQEENLGDIIKTKEPDLFKRICFIDISDFEELEKSQFFKNEVLDKAIFKFKNQELVSRDWNEIIKENFILNNSK